MSKGVLSNKGVIKYDFKNVPNLSGWNKIVVNPKSGLISRWTGPETESFVDVPLKPNQEYVVTIKLVDYMTDDILSSFKMMVNDAKNVVKLTMVGKRGKNVRFKGVIPKRFIRRDIDFTRIIFQVNKTISFHSRDPSIKDKRLLGLHFGEIEFLPQ